MSSRYGLRSRTRSTIGPAISLAAPLVWIAVDNGISAPMRMIVCQGIAR
jgi:hypothetical protein